MTVEPEAVQDTVRASSTRAEPAAPATGTGGDRLGFGDFYLTTLPGMVRLARVLVDSPELAEDLVQDAFVRVQRHWSTIEAPERYLRRCVVNACRSHYRRARRERAWRAHAAGDRSSAGGAAESPGRTAAAPAGWASGDVDQARADDAEALASALKILPVRQRAAIVLRYYSDLPDAEIASVLGCRVGTVASLVHRGLGRLREVIET